MIFLNEAHLEIFFFQIVPNQKQKNIIVDFVINVIS